MGFFKLFNLLGHNASDQPSIPSTTSDLPNKVLNSLVEKMQRSMISIGDALTFHAAYIVYLPDDCIDEMCVYFAIVSDEAVKQFEKVMRKAMRSAQGGSHLAMPEEYWSLDVVFVRSNGVVPAQRGNSNSREFNYDELKAHGCIVRSQLTYTKLQNSTVMHGSEQTVIPETNSMVKRVKDMRPNMFQWLKSDGSGYRIPIRLEGLVEAQPQAQTQPMPATPAPAPYQASAPTPAPAPAPGHGKLRNPYAQRPPQQSYPQPIIETSEPRGDSSIMINNPYSFIDERGRRVGALEIGTHFFVMGASASPMYKGWPTVRIDSDKVLNPHFEMRRANDGQYQIYPVGSVAVNNRLLPQGLWSAVGNNATIRIVNDIVLTVKQ